jgi:DNA end-binding protein Ku
VPPRALWSGSITFGLVNVPVRLYTAIAEHKLHFHLVHERDTSPIGYRKVCKAEDKAVPDDEIVKAYEVDKGEYVYMTDEDFEAAEVEGYKTIDIRDFVPYDEIDPIYFERTYYLGPQEGSEKVYALLLSAMEDAGLAAVATYVMRDRQNLGCLRIRDGVILLEKMFFVDEIRPTDEIGAKKAKVDERELRMAAQLVESFTSEWDPEQYHDTYRDALLEVIEAKRKGKEVKAAAPVAEEEPTDLLAALRASVERASRGQKGRGGARRSSDGDLSSLTRAELEERARDADIPGRSKMSKDELVEALERAA